MEQPARTAPVEGFSVRKRVIRLQIIEKNVESSRSSPERLKQVKCLATLSGSNTLPRASVTASFTTSQEASIRICDLLCDLPFRIPVAAI